MLLLVYKLYLVQMEEYFGGSYLAREHKVMPASELQNLGT